MYCGFFKTDLTNVTYACDLIYAANKYCIPPLVKECTKYIESNVDYTTVIPVYEFAKFMDVSSIKETCLQVFF